MALKVTLTDKRQAVLDAYAAANGTTTDKMMQERLDQEADRIAENEANSWWNSKTLDEKEALANA